MSEEIIIDGVNVKDCRRRIGKNSYCRYFKRSCADNNFNCIWKQHGRLKEKNTKLKDEIGYLQQVLLQIKDIAMCGDCEYDCDNCMQGQIDKLIREALNGRED